MPQFYRSYIGLELTKGKGYCCKDDRELIKGAAAPFFLFKKFGRQLCTGSNLKANKKPLHSYIYSNNYIILYTLLYIVIIILNNIIYYILNNIVIV